MGLTDLKYRWGEEKKDNKEGTHTQRTENEDKNTKLNIFRLCLKYNRLFWKMFFFLIWYPFGEQVDCFFDI